MRLILLMIVVVGSFGTMIAVQTKQVRQKVPLAYELYSWQDSHGRWEFALLPHTSRNHTAAEIFADQTVIHGVDELKKRLSKLTEGTVVYWPRTIPEVGSRLRYPPQAKVQGIQVHARAHEIRLDIEGPVTP